MSLERIAEFYNVPAKKGQRVRFQGSRCGVIEGSNCSYLEVKLDGDEEAELYHPTWELEYLPEDSSEDDKTLEEAATTDHNEGNEE